MVDMIECDRPGCGERVPTGALSPIVLGSGVTRFVCEKCKKELTRWWYRGKSEEQFDREALQMANRGSRVR